MSKTHAKKTRSRVGRAISTDPEKMITAADAERVHRIIIDLDDLIEYIRRKKGWPGYPVHPGTILNKARRQMVTSIRQLRKASVKMESAMKRDITRREIRTK